MDHLHTIICSKHIHTNIKITNIETKRRVPNFLRNPYYKNQKILLPVKILNLIEMWATIQVVRLECSQPKGLRSIRKRYSRASKKKKKNHFLQRSGGVWGFPDAACLDQTTMKDFLSLRVKWEAITKRLLVSRPCTALSSSLYSRILCRPPTRTIVFKYSKVLTMLLFPFV